MVVFASPLSHPVFSSSVGIVVGKLSQGELRLSLRVELGSDCCGADSASGVSVNYTALTFVVHPSPQLTLENLVWNPQFNHIRFNVYALTSWWEKERGGRSLPFIVYHHYLPAAPPPGSPSRFSVFDMRGWDELDFWLLQAWRRPETEFGRPVARTLIGVLGVGLLASALRLMRLMRYARSVGIDAAAAERGAVAEDSAKRPWRRKWRVLRTVRGKA